MQRVSSVEGKTFSYFGEVYVPDPEKVDRSCCCDICWNEDASAKPKAILIKAADRKAEQTSGFKSFPKPVSTKKRTFGAIQSPRTETDSVSKAIADQLKKWRKKAADELHVPPYVIFGDKTMLDIAARKPKTERELMNCYGIGENKAEKFGYYIIRIVKDNCE